MTYLGRAQYWLIFISCYEHFPLCRKLYTRRAGQLMRGPCVKKKAIFLTLHFSPGLAEGRWDDREGRPGGRGRESGSSVTSYKGIFSKHRLGAGHFLPKIHPSFQLTTVTGCSTQSPSLVPAHFSSLIPRLMSLWTWWYQPCCCWPCSSQSRECSLLPPWLGLFSSWGLECCPSAFSPWDRLYYQVLPTPPSWESQSLPTPHSRPPSTFTTPLPQTSEFILCLSLRQGPCPAWLHNSRARDSVQCPTQPTSAERGRGRWELSSLLLYCAQTDQQNCNRPDRCRDDLA